MLIKDTNIAAVLDTNVVLDIFSCHDYSAKVKTVGTAMIDAPELIYRRARARESILLAMYLDQIRGTTYSVSTELRERMVENVPTTGADFVTHFVKLFLYFVKDELLPNWHLGVLGGGDGGVVCSDADDHLLEFAQRHKKPLITNEGYTQVGIAKWGLRKRAEAIGADAYAPQEFWAGKIDEDSAIDSFLNRFASRAPGFIAKQSHPEVTKESLLWMHGYYRHVLRGETSAPPSRCDQAFCGVSG